ncbi:MAG: hypothetical protein KAU50_09510 [Candidatus Marinimicrobia bacterium]|nr:hypothetical protein [Candidatus Neomarinimicrobiota bacterium]
MIDILDPNVNLPPAPVPTTAQPVEPVEADTVSVQDNRLEEEKRFQEQDLEEKRKRAQKDSVELSDQKDSNEGEKDEDEEPETAVEADDEHKIDIIIK